MYILQSIQEFEGKKIGIYTFGKHGVRSMNKAHKILLTKGIPSYAIFTLGKKITKGQHKLFVNLTSSVMKNDESDGTEFESNITI